MKTHVCMLVLVDKPVGCPPIMLRRNINPLTALPRRP